MKNNIDKQEETIRKAVSSLVIIIIVFGVIIFSFLIGYKIAKQEYYLPMYESGLKTCNSVWEEKINKEREKILQEAENIKVKKRQISKTTELILYLKIKKFPEVNTTKYTLYNNSLNLSADFDDNGKDVYYSSFWRDDDSINEKIIENLKNQIAQQMIQKFVIEQR